MGTATPAVFAASDVVVNWSLGAVSVGAAVLAIVLAMRHIRQLRRVQREIEHAQEKTEELRTQMLDALELHDVVVTDEHLKHCVRHLSDEYARILHHKDGFQTRLARRDLERATELVRMGAEGHIMIGADAFSHAETLASILLDMAERGDEFWASSLVLPDFWAHAAAYLRQQEEAIEDRDVKIHRVFVFDTREEHQDEHAQQQIQLQIGAGITVKNVIAPRTAPRDLVVVRRRSPELRPNVTAEVATIKWREAYAMECKVGSDKRIDHIDLWSANELQSEMVKRTWWALQGIFSEPGVDAEGREPSP